MERQGLLYRVDRIAATLGGLSLFLMMAVGTADVVLSNVANRPVPGTYEMTETLMVASAFLAMALAQAQGAHIRVDLITSRLPNRARATADLASQLLTAALFLGIAWYGWDSALHSMRVGEFSSGSLALPMWPARTALALGASLMVVQALHDVWRDIRHLVSGNSADGEGA